MKPTLKPAATSGPHLLNVTEGTALTGHVDAAGIAAIPGSRIKLFMGLVAAIGFATAFFLWVAPWNVVAVGPDEGMEFSKMLLLLNHPEGVQLAWNDQQWFYTKFFSSLFLVTGCHFWIPRLATLIIVICLPFAFLRCMPYRARWQHAFCAGLFFLTWPNAPALSLAAMLELPAVALATIAVALLPREPAEWRKWRFACAGALFAVAFQIKLTALLWVPVAAFRIIEVGLRNFRDDKNRDFSTRPSPSIGKFLPSGVGLAVFLAVSVMLISWGPNWNWTQLWGSHQAASATQLANGYRFNPGDLLDSPGTLAAALIALVIAWRQKCLAQLSFSLILLGTVTLVHLFHRPYWYYYGIHFAIPLSVLAGWGSCEAIRLSVRNSLVAVDTGNSGLRAQTMMMLGALAISLWLGFEVPHTLEDVSALHHLQTVKETEAVSVLGKYRGQVKWAYVRDPILTVHAGYSLPPELTVVPLKRFWSGNITENSILNIVTRYQCEVLVLGAQSEMRQEGWNKLVETNYVKVWYDADTAIFVAKRLNPQLAPKREELLRRLKL